MKVTWRHAAAGGAAIAAVTALGVPAGLLWWLVAPRAEVTVGTGGEILPYPVTETLFAGEGYFALLTMAFGLLSGYGVYLGQYRLAARWRTDIRVVTLLGLCAGAILGSLLAWTIGVRLDGPGFQQAVATAEPGDTVLAGLQVRAHGALLLWPFVAVLQYGLFDAVSMWRGDLGHVAAGPSASTTPVSSGSPPGA